MLQNSTLQADEFSRVLDLSELDLDYTSLNDKFKDLTKLAARVAGTDMSFLNLIDSFTQWTVSNHGVEPGYSAIAREESVCQYTILESDYLEIEDLKLDERFKENPAISNNDNFKFYFGVPLKTQKGNNIGALCVLDKDIKSLNPEKIELLKIIADEIVNRLTLLQAVKSLQQNLDDAKEVKKRVAHDIRGPIGGIIGLAQLISRKGDKNQLDEVLQFINLIQKSGNSLLALADEILSIETNENQANPKLAEHELNLLVFKNKLEELYLPQSKTKNINFSVNINPSNAVVPFPRHKLLQITGNLISNAIKFTPSGGSVTVQLDLVLEGENQKTLHIKVSDSGIGLAKAALDDIINGTSKSTEGTKGEVGYGFGLPLVKYLVNSLNGTMEVSSEQNIGTCFTISLPIG